jgi:hypothetical protein
VSNSWGDTRGLPLLAVTVIDESKPDRDTLRLPGWRSAAP